MKLKRTMLSIAAFACAAGAHAQSAGSVTLATGWLHFAPRDSSGPLQVTNIGGSPVSITDVGSGAGVSSADTVAVSAAYFITDHVSTEFVLGAPPKFDLSGTGTLASYGKIGETKQWSPSLLLRYHFLDAQSRFRPYVGLGVSYVWYSGSQITNSTFANNVLQGSVTSVSASSSWAPLFNAGFTYQFTKHWFGGFSVSYLPLSTTATINSVGSTLPLHVTSQAKITINPIITYLNVGYKF